MCKKNILIGNGININYGGKDYTNGKIIERLTNNLSIPEKYDDVFRGTVSAEELLSLINGLNDVFNKMLKQSILALRRTETEEEIRALIDISRRYKGKAYDLLDVGMEDYFFVMKWFNNGFPDGDSSNKGCFDGLKWLFLDAIYNEGKIEELATSMEPFAKALLQFDKIFTVNYDTNLDRLVDKRVYHLHGSFSELDDTYRPETFVGSLASKKENPPHVIEGKEHLYCNAIMGYSGPYKLEQMERYKKLNKSLASTCMAVHEYPLDEFCSIEGELHILGMSPSNDSHIINMINNNPGIHNVVYYCTDAEIFAEAQGVIKKPMQMRNVIKYWKSL